MAVTQSHFRFGVNSGTEANHPWYAAEDTNPSAGSLPPDTTFLLRFCLQCDATALSNIDAEFQYRKNGGTWTQITTATTNVRAVNSILTEGGNTTQRLSGTGTFETTSAGQTVDGISGGTAFDIVASGNGETECSLQLRSADLADGDVIDFRLTRDGAVLLDTYSANPSFTYKATISSAGTGDWHSTGTWTGGVVPGDGHQVSIGSGHVVTIQPSHPVTTGRSSLTGVIGITVIGTLTLNDKLTLRGDLSQQQTGIVNIDHTGSNLGDLTIDPANGQQYQWVTPNTGSGTPAITITGGSTYVTVKTDTARGGSRSYCDWTLGANSPTLNFTNVDWKEWGGNGDTVPTRAISYAGSAACSVTLTNVKFRSNIGIVRFTFAGLSDFTFDMENCDFRVPLNTTFLHIEAGTAQSSGLRQMKNCTMAHTGVMLNDLWVRDFLFEGNVSLNTRWISDVQDQDLIWRGNAFFFNATQSGLVSIGGRANANILIEECLFGYDQNTSDNPHYTNFVAGGPSLAAEVLRLNVVDGFSFIAADTGDFGITVGTMTLYQNLLINGAGVLFTGASTTGSYTSYRNTLCNAGASPTIGETLGNANAVVKHTSCLFAFNPHGIHQDTAFVSQTSFDLDYNGFWNMTNDTNVDHPIIAGGPNSYLGNPATAAWWTAGAFGDDNKGLHDIYADPQFVDKDRTLISWYNTIAGSGGTHQTVREAMLKLNGVAADGTDSAFTSDYTIANAKTYLRAGFKPQNSVYYNAADPNDGGGSIGAIDLDTPPAPPQITLAKKSRLRAKAVGACAI